MRHKIIIDESVDFRLVTILREKGFDTLSILEEFRSVPDEKVLEITINHKAILLTEDSDFGEWVFSHKKKGFGVIFLRYLSSDIEKISTSLIYILKKYKNSLFDKFVVIKTNKIRIRDI